MSNMFRYEFFWDLLTYPENYDDELDYYRTEDLEEGEYCLKDIVHQVSNLAKDDIFWSVVLSVCDDILSKGNSFDKDLVRFIEMLKNRFIGILNGNAKKACCQVNTKIEAIKEQFRNSGK